MKISNTFLSRNPLDQKNLTFKNLNLGIKISVKRTPCRSGFRFSKLKKNSSLFFNGMLVSFEKSITKRQRMTLLFVFKEKINNPIYHTNDDSIIATLTTFLGAKQGAFIFSRNNEALMYMHTNIHYMHFRII